MVNIYIGLLRHDGTEPDPISGYRRVGIGACDIVAKPILLGGQQILFPQAKPPGYGVIDAVAIFDQPSGGSCLGAFNFPCAQDCCAGVTPIVKNGQLCRGVEMQAKVTMNSAKMFGGL